MAGGGGGAAVEAEMMAGCCESAGVRTHSEAAWSVLNARTGGFGVLGAQSIGQLGSAAHLWRLEEGPDGLELSAFRAVSDLEVFVPERISDIISRPLGSNASMKGSDFDIRN